MKRIARRYAKAFFEMAVEQRILDRVEQDMLSVSETLDTNDDLKTFLANPLVHERKKYQVVRDIFTEKLEELTFNFLLMVTEKKRISHLQDIIEEFRLLMLGKRNEVEGELISAVSLEDNQVERIKDNVESMIGKSILLKQDVDASIIGGFVVRVQDMVIDNSIRYQLNKLREQLIAE